MRDRFFFALAAVVAGAFVFTALRPFDERPPRGPWSCGGCPDVTDVTLSGRELHRFLPGNFDGIEIVDTAEGPILRITLLAEEVYLDPRSGPHIMLAEDLEYAFESRPIEITIEARTTADDGASRFEANYFAKPEGESGWHAFDLTATFQPYAFVFDAPVRGATEGNDFLGIRPVVPEKRRVMEVRSVRIHALGPKAAPPPVAPG